MAKPPFRIKRCKHPTYKFVVRDKITGNWRRKFFTSEREAKTYVDLKTIELHNHGRDGVMFPAELRVMAHRAKDQLDPFGKTIDDAVGFYLKHLQTECGSVPVRQAVNELITNRASSGMSKLYLRDLKYRLGRFVSAVGERTIASITTKEIVKWLESLGVGAVTRNIFRRDIRTLFSFCCGRKYCIENPVAVKETLAKEPRTEVAVLSVEDTQSLLEKSSPEMLPYWAIGLFAGLRSSEIRNLQWSDVDFDDALITVRSTKTNRKRFVKMEPNLIAWLAPYREHDGFVVRPINFRRQSPQDRIAAGLLGSWPLNAMRHSFGSYWLAGFNDVNKLALEIGNSPTVIEKHYRKAVKPTEAHRYWKIMPSSDAEKKTVAFTY